MKKGLIFLVILVFVLVGGFLLMSQSDEGTAPVIGDSSAGGSAVIESGEPEPSGTSVAEVEAALGVSLPGESVITVFLDNPRAVGTHGTSEDSVEEMKAHFTAELEGAGLRMTRPWGLLPQENENHQTAVFTGSGETWAVILKNEGSFNSFDIQRQK